MRRLIGRCIEACSRRALRAYLGVRLPAAHIRRSDQLKNREFVAAQLRETLAESRAWLAELDRIDCAIAAQDLEVKKMERQRAALRDAAPDDEEPWRITP